MLPPNHYFILSFFIYLLCFRFAALGADHIPLADLQIIDHQTRLSDHPRPSQPTLDQTTTDPRQTRPPNQITPPDHRPPALTTRPPISTAYQTLWTGTGQVHSLWVGTRGVYRALDEPCKAYFPHTFGLKFPDFFRLNLSLLSLASGVPWAGKGLPFPFSLDGFLCRCSVSNKNSAFRNRFGFLDSASIQGNSSAASFCAFSDGRHHRCFSRRRLRLRSPA